MISSNLYPTTTPRTQHFAGDSGKCDRCQTTISRNEIQTDWLGRTVVVCPSCGPMLLVLRRGVSVGVKHDARVFRKKPWASNPDSLPCPCGEPVKWCGRGRKPVLCPKCVKADYDRRQVEYQAQYNVERRARTAAKNKRKAA